MFLQASINQEKVKINTNVEQNNNPDVYQAILNNICSPNSSIKDRITRNKSFISFSEFWIRNKVLQRYKLLSANIVCTVFLIYYINNKKKYYTNIDLEDSDSLDL